ncbi:MAG: replication factor C large subunit [Methanoregula sp.]|jgi:replication factor C large subunit|uniref:replication factor C large subunit n=1 Tax=Methanoregula sp. TaxID=2052170 RepID=UPI003D1298D2
MDWAEKYRPAHLADIVGNTTAVRQIAEWARTWTRRSRPVLIYGKPGIGKTSCAYALANDMNWEVIELNASDQRTAAVIERIAGEGSTTASLTGSFRKLIVLDEADNLQGTADRGGARAIIECIRGARQPMILIANDLYGLSPEIRARCEPVQFKAIPARSIAPRLKYLCSAEKVACSEAAVHAIAESAEGDIRSAVNMLYASAIGRDSLDDSEVHTSQKDVRVSIFSLIAAIFGKIPDDDLIRLSYEVEDTPETVEQWVEGNVHLIPDMSAVESAYRYLSRADEYLGYTYRRQYYTLWRYATAVMLLGVADAAGGRGIHARIMPPERWQKMSTAKKQKAIRVATLNRIAGLIHVPQSTLREEYLGTISMLIEHDPAGYSKEMSFDYDQLNFFLNDRARSAEIIRMIVQEEKGKEKEQQKEQQKKPKKEKIPGEEIPRGLPAENADPEEPAEKKATAKTQSTLFDGF